MNSDAGHVETSLVGLVSGRSDPTRWFLAVAIAAGVVLAVDAAVLDLFFGGSTAARVAGLMVAPLGAVGLVGLYLAVRPRSPAAHLDVGFALNLVGFGAVSALSFTRNLVIDPIDDTTLDVVVAAGPLVAGLIAAGVMASIGFIAFGTALLRSGADGLGALAYAVLLPASGFAAQMPPALAAVVQGLAAAAVVRLAFVELGRLDGRRG